MAGRTDAFWELIYNTPSSPPSNIITVNNPGNQVNEVGQIVSLQIVATDSDPSQILTYSAVGLPASLNISSSTGLISGTITATTGNYPVTVTVTDPTGASGHTSFSWTLTPAPTQHLLIISIAPETGTDQYGNKYLEGVTSYQQPGGNFSNLNGGMVSVGNVDANANSNPGSMTNEGPQPQGGTTLDSGTNGALDTSVHIDLISLQNNTNTSVACVVVGSGPASGGFDAVDGSRFQVVDGDILTQNFIHRLDPDVPSIRESPHLFTGFGYTNGWKDSDIGPRGAAVLLPIPNLMMIYGDLTGGTLTDGTTIVTLSSSYRPVNGWVIGVTIPGTGAAANMRLFLGNGGQLQCFGMSGLGAGPRVTFSMIINLNAA